MNDPESINGSIFLLANSFSIEDWLGLGLILVGMLVFLVCSAFVSASEIAFFSIDNTRLNTIKLENEEKGERIAELLAHPDRLLATILIVNNTVNIALILFSSIAMAKIETIISAPAWVFFIFQIVFITALILLFGEIIPKVYATQKTEELAKMMAKPMQILNKATAIPSFFLVKLARLFDRKLKNETKGISIDELSEVHELVQGNTSKQELKMLDGILEIGNTEVRQIMKNRTSITALTVGNTFDDVRQVILESGYSRMPVYEDNLDTIKGVLYIKDLLPFLNDTSDKNHDWLAVIRQPFFVPESKKLDDLLSEFQELKIHLAIVIDEYGGTSGLITLEDIIEEIVGEVRNEFDDDELEYSVLGEGKYVFDGKISLLDFYRILEIEGDVFEAVKGESETIAGLLIELKGGFPKKGEVIKLKNYEITVEAIDKKRIQRIKLVVHA